jgi:hypothetical protein
MSAAPTKLAEFGIIDIPVHEKDVPFDTKILGKLLERLPVALAILAHQIGMRCAEDHA